MSVPSCGEERVPAEAATISGSTQAPMTRPLTTARAARLRPRISSASSMPSAFCPMIAEPTMKTRVSSSELQNAGSLRHPGEVVEPDEVRRVAPAPVSAMLVNAV